MNKNKNYTIYSSNYANANFDERFDFPHGVLLQGFHELQQPLFPKNLYEGRSVGGKSLAGDIQSQRYLWDNFLMFNRTFKSRHNVSATLGVSWRITATTVSR